MDQTPTQIYLTQLSKGKLLQDVAQLEVLTHFDRLHQALLDKPSWYQWLFSKKVPITGIYLWGGVGIGKTFMMDCFFESLPFGEKHRCHFHQFMKEVHEQLNLFQGERNPLLKIAKQYSEKYRVLCFDEFFVKDVTDAMVLGELFIALLNEGIALVCTSNLPPEKVYQYGLQRDRFKPAINAIQRHTELVHLASEMDYRLQHVAKEGVFYSPLNDSSAVRMEKAFALFSRGEVQEDILEVEGRVVNALKHSDNAAWFSFEAICGIPRCQRDYLALVKTYRYIFISGFYKMMEAERNIATNFINLVDICYDHKIKLIISSEISLEALSLEGDLSFEFDRTLSRLIEMQSRAYFE